MVSKTLLKVNVLYLILKNSLFKKFSVTNTCFLLLLMGMLLPRKDNTMFT